MYVSSTFLKVIISVEICSGDNIWRIIVTSSANIHATVSLNISTASIIARDTLKTG